MIFKKIGHNLANSGDSCDHFLSCFVIFTIFEELWSERWRRCSKKVVGNAVGDVEGCFGNGNKVPWRDFCSCVRWCDGSFVRFVRPLVRSFVLWFVRSMVRSFARRKNYIREPLRELAHNSR